MNDVTKKVISFKNDENINSLLTILIKALNENDFADDTQNVIYLCDSLKESQNSLPTLDELEKIKNIEIDLEIKYECFYEIGNYFDPWYVEVKKIIHKEKVNKLREENRKKRGIK